MSTRPPASPSDPTDAELTLLGVLWERGPSTVREVYEAVYRKTDVGYTTALKTLQNMHAKRLVTRQADGRQHVYAAAVPRDRTLRAVVGRLADRTFGGSAGALALHALGTHRATPSELAEIKRLIRRLEREERSSDSGTRG